MTTYSKIESIIKKLPGHDRIISDMIWNMITQGRTSTCEKSKRVVSIYSPIRKIYVLGTNSPPLPFSCSKNEKCKQNCAKIAVHAEERAMLKAAKCGLLPKEGLHCFHLKIKDNVPVISGEPSCIHCSKNMLEYGISCMWLLQETGWKSWKLENFHRETMKNLGISTNE